MLFCLLNFWLFSPSLILMGKCFQQKFKCVFTFFCSSNLLFPFHPNFQSFLALLSLFFFYSECQVFISLISFVCMRCMGCCFLATLSQNSRTGPLTFEGINWKVCNSRYITESCSLRSWKKSGPPTGWACAFEILKEKVVEHSNRKRKGMFCDNYVVLNIMFQGL